MAKKFAFFRHGILSKISIQKPTHSLYEDRQIAYDLDTVIDSDGSVYDPSQPETISNLSIPAFDSTSQDTVFDLSYILKSKCSMIENPALIPAFVSKTLDMMLASPIMWRRGDYLRVICNYYCNGLFEEGDCFEAAFRASHKDLFSDPLDNYQEIAHRSAKYHFEDKWRRHNEYAKVKALLPDLVPNTVQGYLQIRTRKTKHFLAIQKAAEEAGMVFDFEKDYHFCRRFQDKVKFSYEYDHSGRYPMPVKCECLRYTNVDQSCNGVDEFGLPCFFPLPPKNNNPVTF